MPEAKVSYEEEDYIPLSAVQHFVYCPRQCALIHVERAWVENRFTAEGRILHERAHVAGRESRGNVRRVRGLMLRSDHYGLIGRADLVEFHRRLDGKWQPYPVEYKRGKPKPGDCDRLQLCGQAICLEEMLLTEVPEGALFYKSDNRRETVDFRPGLRTLFEDTVFELRKLIDSKRTPPPQPGAKCRACSLAGICRPRLIRSPNVVRNYLDREVGAD
jgi:CRISPR-associated exonuclease Cas4